MCKLGKERFDELVNVEKPKPNEVKTTDVINSNGYVSLIEKGDGTIALRDEMTCKENGSFLTKKEAEETYNDIICEE